jgi:uncharacterized protein (TIGR03435 family)
MPRVAGEGVGRQRVQVSPGGVTFSYTTLAHAILWAYDVRSYQVSGPEWIWQDRYEIEAKTEHRVTVEQLRMLMQGLLADRFHLAVHRDSPLKPVYELVAGKGGVKLRESTEKAGMGVVDKDFLFMHVTMPEFAERLSDLAALDRPVLNATGIAGVYDVILPRAAWATRDEPEPIFDALGELGLELKAAKAPIEVILVDHAEKPTAN